jgi:hypothetical protein
MFQVFHLLIYGCGVDQRVLEDDFVVVTGTGAARDFIRLLTVELH